MTEIIAVRMGDRDECFDRVDVLRFNLCNGRIGRQQSETSQRLDESICNCKQNRNCNRLKSKSEFEWVKGTSLQRHVENTSDTNGTANAVKAQGGNFQIITILQAYTEWSQKRSPGQLKQQKENRLAVNR